MYINQLSIYYLLIIIYRQETDRVLRLVEVFVLSYMLTSVLTVITLDCVVLIRFSHSLLLLADFFCICKWACSIHFQGRMGWPIQFWKRMGRPIQLLTQSLAGSTHWPMGQYGEWVRTHFLHHISDGGDLSPSSIPFYSS